MLLLGILQLTEMSFMLRLNSVVLTCEHTLLFKLKLGWRETASFTHYLVTSQLVVIIIK